MKITSTYSVRLRNFNRVFDDTVEVYRHAVEGVSGFLCLGRLFQGQPNEAALCI